jgi:hypothetical protein
MEEVMVKDLMELIKIAGSVRKIRWLFNEIEGLQEDFVMNVWGYSLYTEISYLDSLVDKLIKAKEEKLSKLRKSEEEENEPEVCGEDSD